MDGKLLDLYDMAEVENINFLNRILPNSVGTTVRSKSGITIIYISTKLNERQELIVLSHEMGHYLKDSPTRKNERIAWEWTATYIIPYEDYTEALRSPFVNSDYEAAAFLRVPIKIYRIAQRYYQSQGLPVSQSDLGYVYREP